MDTWSPASVLAIITGLTGLVTAIAAIIHSMSVKTDTAVAKATADGAQKTADDNAVHGAVLSERIHELAVQSTPPSQPQSPATTQGPTNNVTFTVPPAVVDKPVGSAGQAFT